MRGHIERRSSGSWKIQASGGFDDAGRRVRVTRTVQGSRRDAERALTKLLHEVDTGQAVVDGKTPLGGFLADKWLPHMRTQVRPKTWQRYEGAIRLHVAPTIGLVRLAQLRPTHVQRVLDVMTEAGCSAASVHKTYRVLASALTQAVRWRILAVNPAAGVRPPRDERRELSVPDAAEVRKLLDAAARTSYELPLLLAATTGMRRGEVLGLRWQSVDLDAGSLAVTTTLQRVRGETVFVAPKTDRSRRKISLPAVTVDALKRHRKEQAERRLLLGAAWVDSDLVVDRGDGEHLDPDTLSTGFRRAAKAAGLEGARLHDLRHSYATTLLAAGVNVKVVSEALGHARTAFTMDVYAHVLPTMGEQAASAIQAAFAGSANK
jgi:integrase